MRKRGALFLCVRLVLLLSAVTGADAAGQPADIFQLNGIVVDITGAAVGGAEISADGVTVVSDARGRFSLPVTGTEVTVRVHAPGFADYSDRSRADRPVRITMQPAGLIESLTVTAGRSAGRLADTASATAVIPGAVLLTAASLAPDDALRSVPGFSLFRRSSSRVANPTTQGASLRGLSASGASRALVLADGIPLNDAFGGWVYWDRVPGAAIDRIEVVRGSTSAGMYGSQSIAGTIQIVTIEPRSATVRASMEGGQHGLARAALFAGSRRGPWSGFLAAERLVFDGFPIVAAAERGAVDMDAGVRYWSGLAKGTRTADRWSIGLRAGVLDEARGNGTPLQRNATKIRSVGLSASRSAATGAWSASAYGGTSDYVQSFSAVNSARSAEVLTASQHIISDYQGASIEWANLWRGATWVAGADARRVKGESQDVGRGGAQTDLATFVQAALNLVSGVSLTAGARVSIWTTSTLHGTTYDQRRGLVTPRASIEWSAAPRLSLTASLSGPFRTPTLNELYRDFQVGSTVTLANAQLRPESAWSAEAGALMRVARGSARLVGFWTSLGDAIANLTQPSPVGRILRERRNAGRIRARGIEAEAEWRANSWTSVTGSATWLDSTFARSEEPGLTGKRVPQVPRWQGSLSLRLTPGRAVATVDWRTTGSQFDDDRNQFELRPATVLDIYLGASLRRGLQPFLAIENVLDAEVDVGRTPVRTVGTPRSLRAGMRFFLP